MRITPLDVRKQEFGKSMRGFDCDEVRAFLNTLADEYEAVLMDSKQIRERTLELEDKLGEYQRMEKNLRDTLLTAERLTQETRVAATHEGELIIRDAEMKARGVLEECRLRTEELRREITGLRKEKESYLARFRSLAEAQIQFIDTHRSDFEDLDRRLTDIVDTVVTRTGTAAPGSRHEAPVATKPAAAQAWSNPYVQAPAAPPRVQAPVAAPEYAAPSVHTAPAASTASAGPAQGPMAPTPANDIWRDYIPGRNAAAVAAAPSPQQPAGSTPFTPAAAAPFQPGAPAQFQPAASAPFQSTVKPAPAYEGAPRPSNSPAAESEEDFSGVIAQSLAEAKVPEAGSNPEPHAERDEPWRPEPVVTEVTNF